MKALEKEDPLTWDALESGNVCVRKSDTPFTSLFVYQTLEQEIKKLKGIGGITGLTQLDEILEIFSQQQSSLDVLKTFRTAIFAWVAVPNPVRNMISFQEKLHTHTHKHTYTHTYIHNTYIHTLKRI